MNVSVESSAQVFCSQCRALIDASDSVCENCGAERQISSSKPAWFELFERLKPSRLPKLRLLIGLTIVCVMGAALFGGAALLEKGYESFTVGYPVEQAEKLYQNGQFDEAITILERLDVTRPLSAKQHLLLNNIYMAKADYLTQKQVYAVALSTLGRISHDYPKFAVVEQRRSELMQMLSDSKAQATKKQRNAKRRQPESVAQAAANPLAAMPNAASSKLLPQSSAEKELMQVKTGPKPVKGVQISDGQPTPFPAPGGASAAQAISLIPTPAASVAAPTISPAIPSPIPSRASAPTTSTPVSVVAAARQATTAIDSRKPGEPVFLTVRRVMGSSIVNTSAIARKAHIPQAKPIQHSNNNGPAEQISTDPNAVRYNELLAGYFSRPPKNSETTAEPPSLREWVEQGKPNF